MFRLTPDRRLPRRLFEPDDLWGALAIIILNVFTLGPAVLAIWLLGSLCAGPVLPPDITAP